MKLARPKSIAQVRRNGWSQTKRKPSASRARDFAGSRSRSCWNGVRIASSEIVENVYESASTTNGSDRPRPNNAPPNGGPPSRTTATRPVSAAAAAGSCRGGTTARSAPAWAPEKSAEPQPSTNPTDEDLPERRPVEGNRRREASHGEHAHAVGEDHQAPAVPAIGREPRGQREDRPGQASRKGDDARFRRRVGDREHEQRIRDRGRLCSGARQQLSRLQEHEVAIASQRDRGHERHHGPRGGRASPADGLGEGRGPPPKPFDFVALVSEAVRR